MTAVSLLQEFTFEFALCMLHDTVLLCDTVDIQVALCILYLTIFQCKTLTFNLYCAYCIICFTAQSADMQFTMFLLHYMVLQFKIGDMHFELFMLKHTVMHCSTNVMRSAQCILHYTVGQFSAGALSMLYGFAEQNC